MKKKKKGKRNQKVNDDRKTCKTRNRRRNLE